MGASERVRSFLQKNMLVEDKQAKFTDDDNIFELGFIDSMVALKLVTYIEKEFGIAVSNEDLDLQTFSTVNNIVRLIERKQGSASKS